MLIFTGRLIATKESQHPSVMKSGTVQCGDTVSVQFLTFTYFVLDVSAAGTKAVNPLPFPGPYKRLRSFIDRTTSLGKKKLKRGRSVRDQDGSVRQELEMRTMSFKVPKPDASPNPGMPAMHQELNLSEAIQNLLFDQIAICAMQFGGYVSVVQKAQARLPDVPSHQHNSHLRSYQ